MKIRLILWRKSGKFAHSDAEAPLSVFLFHRYLFLRGEEYFIGSSPRFLLRKIIIILLICSIMAWVADFADSVPDFRRTNKGNLRHKLSDIIVLIILGRLSKCVGRTEIIEFGRHNLLRFRSMGMLRNGVPSEATLYRIDQGIDELCLAEKMSEFIAIIQKEFNPQNESDIISILILLNLYPLS